jgi:cytochrome P450
VDAAITSLGLPEGGIHIIRTSEETTRIGSGQLASAGECEFVEAFGNPLPLAVMCHLLGVPAEDYDMFRVWTAKPSTTSGSSQSATNPAACSTASHRGRSGLSGEKGAQ